MNKLIIFILPCSLFHSQTHFPGNRNDSFSVTFLHQKIHMLLNDIVSKHRFIVNAKYYIYVFFIKYYHKFLLKNYFFFSPKTTSIEASGFFFSVQKNILCIHNYIFFFSAYDMIICLMSIYQSHSLSYWKHISCYVV